MTYPFCMGNDWTSLGTRRNSRELGNRREVLSLSATRQKLRHNRDSFPHRDDCLAATDGASYSHGIHQLWVLLPAFAVLGFFGAVYAGCVSWRNLSRGKRVAGVLLLAPHFLLLVCFVVSVLCGHAPQGSPCFNAQFFFSVLMVFILPVPALAGTLLALVVFLGARTQPRP